MKTTSIRSRGIRSCGKNMYFYYRCPRRLRFDKEACPNGKNHRADQAESRVWEFVSAILKDPEKLEADLERMIEQERNGLRSGSGEEAEIWTKRMKECTTQREKRLEQHVEGLITLDELKEKLNAIEETRKVAERELSRFKDLRAEISNLEKDKEALIESYANLVPEALDSLTPDERQQVYRMLKLRVMAHPDGTLEAAGCPRAMLVKAKSLGGDPHPKRGRRHRRPARTPLTHEGRRRGRGRRRRLDGRPPGTRRFERSPPGPRAARPGGTAQRRSDGGFRERTPFLARRRRAAAGRLAPDKGRGRERARRRQLQVAIS